MLRPLDETERAENWRVAAKAARRLFILALLPFLALIWASGYGQGWLDGQAARRETISKESNYGE